MPRRGFVASILQEDGANSSFSLQASSNSMASSLKTTHTRVTYVVLPSMPTTSVQSWAAIVARSKTWSIGRARTCCYRPNSDDCALSPSTATPIPRTNSIWPWGYYSDHASFRFLPGCVLHSAVTFRVCRRTECGTEEQGATHAQRTPRFRRFECCGLAYAPWNHACPSAPATDRADPSVGTKG